MLQKSSIWSTLSIFFESPTEKHYLIEISREIGLAHTSVKNKLEQLIGLGLILMSIEKKGSRKFPTYTANLDNKLFKSYKLLYNLASMLESRLIDYLEDTLMPKSIVLFGSYQRGKILKEVT